MSMLVTAQEALLDEAALTLLEEQNELKHKEPIALGRNFEVDDLVLLSYPTAPPSKLHARVAGPFRVKNIDRNLVTLADITGSRELQRDISMIIPFRYRDDLKDLDLVAIAAGDLGESVVIDIVAYRGNLKNKKELEFQVQWEDGDLTWEEYEKVKHLETLDDFVTRTNDPKLFRAIGKKK